MWSFAISRLRWCWCVCENCVLSQKLWAMNAMLIWWTIATLDKKKSRRQTPHSIWRLRYEWMLFIDIFDTLDTVCGTNGWPILCVCLGVLCLFFLFLSIGQWTRRPNRHRDVYNIFHWRKWIYSLPHTKPYRTKCHFSLNENHQVRYTTRFDT